MTHQRIRQDEREQQDPNARYFPSLELITLAQVPSKEQGKSANGHHFRDPGEHDGSHWPVVREERKQRQGTSDESDNAQSEPKAEYLQILANRTSYASFPLALSANSASAGSPQRSA